MAGLAAAPTGASAKPPASERSDAASFGSLGGGVVAGSGSSLSSFVLSESLVIPGLLGAPEETQAQSEALRATPAAFRARLASETAYEHLSAAHAQALAQRVFPQLIDEPAGGPPALPAGERVTGYESPTVAQLALPGGKHSIVASIQPMAVEVGHGRRLPVDLSLTAAGDAYRPIRPFVAVSIPRHSREGARLLDRGISLTPVDARGSSLQGAEGTAVGSSMLYANTGTDADTVLKPTTEGFEADTILRASDSPEQLYFRVGLPAGASLVQAQSGTSMVKIREHGRTVAVITPPSARDATGISVPVSMRVQGSGLLALSVSVKGAEHAWPIVVDPELVSVTDSALGPGECHKEGESERVSSNWCWHSNAESDFHTQWNCSPSCTVEQYNSGGSIGAGAYTVMAYHTQGESRIYKVEVQTQGTVSKGRARLELARQRGYEEGEVEQATVIAEHGTWSAGVLLCAVSGCPTSGGSAGNIVAFKLEASEPTSESRALEATMWNANVYIAQENAPTLSYNSTAPTIDEGRQNAMFGSSVWIGPSSGALEMVAHDPGIGVSNAGAREVGGGSYSISAPIYGEGKCLGVQCKETYTSFLTYNPGMLEGEDQLELWAENDAHLEGKLGNKVNNSEVKVKVDAAPPSKVKVSGWPSGRELSATSHTLTVKATDGTAPTPSSGVRSIQVAIDSGAPTLLNGSYCSPGECTVTSKYTLAAEKLSEGTHCLLVKATDNAGNVAAQEISFDVRHGTPVTVGPGTVDPTTGQLKLSAADVSLAGAGQVSRAYESRNLTIGTGGPLGPQWALSLGGGEGLTVLPGGNVVLSSSTGATTTFTRNEEGKFESPLGDGNIKLEAKEKVAGKGTSEYLLSDSKAGTTTTFVQPAGTETMTPTYADAFGSEVPNLGGPVSSAIDAHGNVWVAEYTSDRVFKFSAGGVLLGVYGTPGTGENQFESPWGIAVNRSTGNVYISDEGNDRVVELNSAGAFVEAFGWDVNAGGKEEFEICHSACKQGLGGTGYGEISAVQGIAVDPSGDVWVAEYENDRLQEFNEKGERIRKFGENGIGAGQLSGPMNIAFSGGNAYVTDQNNNRVDEFTSAGAFVKTIGWGVANGESKLETCTSSCRSGITGAGNGQFNGPRGLATDPATGNLYVSEISNNRVQELTPSGSFVTKFGSQGSGTGQFSQPMGVAVAPSGEIYVTDYGNRRIQEWLRPAWLPKRTEGPLKSTTAAFAYKPVEEEGTSVIEPTEELAPAPPGVTCGGEGEQELAPSELKKGCRALTFKYSESTKATGEKSSEWGSFAGRIAQVALVAYNPATKAMVETPVAEYSYDAKGRLRAEWDPRISPALKTTYGYDPEGHVTAVSPPGQEPWLVHYGGTGSDSGTGRVLAVVRPKASSASTLKEQDALGAPAMSTRPTISSISPEVGVTLKVTSEGKWSNTPLAYSYRWADCNLISGAKSEEEKVCTPIPGAVNQSYTPQARDAGSKLVVEVAAENAAGASTSASTESNAVPLSTPTYSSSFDGSSKEAGKESPAFIQPVSDAIDSSGDVWVTDFYNDRVAKYSSTGVFMGSYGEWGSGPGQFERPWGIAISPTNGNMFITDYNNNRVDVWSPTGQFLYSFGGPGSAPGQFNAPHGISVDANGDVWVADYYNNRIEEFSEAGTFIKAFGEGGSENGKFNGPTGVLADNGTLYVTDSVNSRVEEFSYEGAYLGKFGKKGTGGGEFDSTPDNIGLDPRNGDLYIADPGDDRVQVFNPQGQYIAKFGVQGTGNGDFEVPQAIAVSSTGSVYVTDTNNNRVSIWTSSYSTLNPAPELPSAGSSSVSTIEYGVPLTGPEVPRMSSGEVEKWGEKDNPTEAMAVFAPDEPQSWPASSYKRATIDYMDEHGHTVNTLTPSGGISTTEYNAANEAVRSLSADDRAAAMKEGCKSIAKKECASAEAAERLDTKTEYNPEESEIVKTLGPEHAVKLANGTQVQARAVTRDYYDEGAAQAEEKNHETYNLITKTTTGALLANGEEKDVRTTTASYNGQEDLGWKLRKATSTTTDPAGLNLTTTTKYDEHTGNAIETITPGGASPGSPYVSQFGSLGSGNGQLSAPKGVAVDAKGDVLVADELNNRIEVFNEKGEYVTAFGSAGSTGGQFKDPRGVAIDASGNIWVADTGNNRLEEFNGKYEFLSTSGWGVSNGEVKFETCASACRAGIAGSGAGQFKEPTSLAFNGNNEVSVTDAGNNRTQRFNDSGGFEGMHGWGVSNGEAKFEICTSNCQAGIPGSGAGQFKEPTGVAYGAHNTEWITDTGNSRMEVFNESGEYEKTVGSAGSGNDQFKEPRGVAIDSSGNVWIVDAGNYRVQELNEKGEYKAQFGAKGTGHGQFQAPFGIKSNAHGEVFVGDVTQDNIQRFIPGAHTVKTTYYTSGVEAPIAACQNHPEWANLLCQAEPAAQPGTSGLPELPISDVTYNLWDEVEATSEKFGTGSVTRTKTQTYDAAGRALTSEETSSPATDTALPKVTNEYNTETGALEKQSATINGVTKTIMGKANTLGQQIEYADAEGNIAKYSYEEGGDGRLDEISEGKGKEAESKATYSYSPTTGFMEKLIDTAAGMSSAQGTFTATYDLEGNMTGEVYPNGMCADTVYNALGAATAIEYLKPKTCTESKPTVWFSDSVVPSIHGETLQQTSTLAKENYAYDNAGRLLETQEIPAGKGCKSRLYGYDEESNRISQITRESSTETCASEGGTVQSHSYDIANRLTDTGVAYETFGNTTKMPAADAGEHEIVSTYFVDNQIASQEQNKQLIKYIYDPAGRTMETVSENQTTKAKTTTISHYAGSGNALTWTSEGSEKWTRNIPGIDGSLDAIQEAGKTPVLQLHDLRGNIVGTVGDSESETKLLSTYNSTEFGVPQPGTTPPKYAWLGAEGVSTEQAQAAGTSTQGGASYVPQLARNLQTESIAPPGSFPNGQGTGSEYGAEIPGWYISLSSSESAATLAEYTAKQEAQTREAFESAEDPWYMTVNAGQLWNVIDKIDGMMKADDRRDVAISAIPGIGDYIDGGWNAYSAYVDGLIARIENDAEDMENERRSAAPAGYFIYYKVIEFKIIGPASAWTGEEETVQIPYAIGIERCKNEGAYENNGYGSIYTTYYRCSSGVQRSVNGRY